MASFVGLDLSANQARILEADGTAKKLKIKNFATVDLEASDATGPAAAFMDKETAEQIGKAFSKNKFSRDPIAMSWDSDHTIFREMTLPFLGEEQIRKVIKYEAESHLLNCDIDDVVVSFYRLREEKEKEKSHLLVMAAKKDHLLNRFEALGRNGIDPMSVDLDVMASFNALSGTGFTKKHDAFMVLDCGRRTTNLLVIENGRLVSGRAIRLGSDSVLRRLAGDIGAAPGELGDDPAKLLEDPDAAHKDDLIVPAATAAGEERSELTKSPEELTHDLATQEASGFFGRLSKEVRRSLVTAKLPETVDVIYVTGPGSLMPGFAEGVANHLPIDAPIEPLRLLEEIDHPFQGDEAKQVESEILTSLGLAYKVAGHDDTGVDFRQEEAQYARKFDQIKEPLVYLCAFLVFLVLLVNLFDIRKLSVRKPFLFHQQHADLTRIHEVAKEKYKRALGAKAPKIPEKYQTGSIPAMGFIQNQLSARIDTLKGELGRGGAIPEQVSAFKAWRDTFEAIEPAMDSIGKLFLKEINISIGNQRDPYIQLVGVVKDATAFSNLVDALRAIPDIDKSRIETGAVNDMGDAGYRFSNLKVYYPERDL